MNKMGFHINPTDKLARELFGSRIEQLNRKRITIGERADRLRARVPAPLDAVRSMMRQDEFTVGSNLVQLECPKELRSKPNAAISILHLSSVFTSSRIRALVDKMRIGEDIMFLAFMPDPLPAAARMPSADETKIARLNFRISMGNKIRLIYLESIRRGYGGDMAAAVYNIARDIGSSLIFFDVFYNNYGVAEFYYHLDFGRPVKSPLDDDENAVKQRWRVNVTPG